MLGDITRCPTSTSCTLPSIFMTLQLPMTLITKCLWQHSTTSSNLELTKIDWSEVFDSTVITIHILKQTQRETLKIHIRPRSVELSRLPPALQKFTKVLHLKCTHPLTRHLNNKVMRHCQSSISDDQERNQNVLQLNELNCRGESLSDLQSGRFLVISFLIRNPV